MDPDGTAALSQIALGHISGWNIFGWQTNLPLSSLAIDILIVLFFVLLGGLFVAAEIALISLREGQIKNLAER